MVNPTSANGHENVTIDIKDKEVDTSTPYIVISKENHEYSGVIDDMEINIKTEYEDDFDVMVYSPYVNVKIKPLNNIVYYQKIFKYN